jgi:hypothetical protein
MGSRGDRSSPRRVVFEWDSGHESISGNIETSLPDGERYQGRFSQITADRVMPLYDGWYGGWDYWGYGPYGGGMTTTYTGRVIAELTSPRGNTMRCQFRLEDPAAGMWGGGIGECRSSDGKRIESAIFRPADT